MEDPPRPRAAIASLPAYVPGTRPEPVPGLTTYKISSNENPYPPLPGIVAAVEEAARRVNRYPDLACTELFAALSDHLGVPTDHLAAATGSVALPYHLMSGYCEPGDRVVHAWRSFEAYPIAITVCHAEAVPVRLTVDARHDLAAMAEAVAAEGERTKVVILCSPNNPTGPALSHTEVADFVARVPPGVLVVLDEAYRDFVRSPDPLDGVALQREHANVVVLRTFAKASGLAGLRVGYAVAHPEVAATIRACALPFAVSGPAQAAAIAALGHLGELRERVDHLVAERKRVVAGLAENGVRVPDTQANFVWLALGDRSAEFAAEADKVGLVVRPFQDGVRVTVAEDEANTRFVQLIGSLPWMRDHLVRGYGALDPRPPGVHKP